MRAVVARETSGKGRVHICFGYGEAFHGDPLPRSKTLQASTWPRGADQLYLQICCSSRLQSYHSRSATSAMAIELFNVGPESDAET